MAHNHSGFGVGGSSSSSSPRLKVSRKVTPFVRKTYEIVRDPHTNDIVSWNTTRNGFIVWDVHRFAADILPCHFKHNNFSSFVCQLNAYGFKKASWEKCEFHHEWFKKGKRSWLKNIKRKSQKTVGTVQDQQPGEESSVLETEKEIEEMQHKQRETLAEIKQLQEQQGNLARELADMMKTTQNLEEKRRQLPMLVSKALIECISELESGDQEDKILIEGQKAVGEMENYYIAIDEEKSMENNYKANEEEKISTDESNLGQLADAVIGLDDLIEGSADWENYLKQLIG